MAHDILIELIKSNNEAQKELRAAMDDKLNQVIASVAGVNQRLDTLNSRTRKAETAIVRLKLIVGAGVAVVAMVLSAIIKHLVGAA